jgi:intracellular protein transport protein USO1
MISMFHSVRQSYLLNQHHVARATISDLSTRLADLQSEIVQLHSALESQRKSSLADKSEIERLKAEKLALEAQNSALQNEKAETERKTAGLEADSTKLSDLEKEQEDLLVLLEEITQKRKRDKITMKQAGLEVSDDEDEG